MIYNVLIVVPCKPSLPDGIYYPMLEQVSKTIKSSKTPCSLYLDTTSEPSEPTDNLPWTKVARVRNKILDQCLQCSYTHFLWVDADVIVLPTGLVDTLLSHNPHGVAAPMVLIEGSQQHYDGSAYIQRHTSHIAPGNRQCNYHGRNFDQFPPYVPNQPEVLEVDCVGTITLVNTAIYESGARYENHPTFTDHFPICERSWVLGRPVTVSRDLIARHADLPKYGLSWH